MFSEDLDAFLADHGKPCSVGTSSFLGIKDAPGELVSVGNRDAISIMHAVLIKSAVVAAAGIKYGTAIVVDGVNFTVREAVPLDDGAFTQINLSKV